MKDLPMKECPICDDLFRPAREWKKCCSGRCRTELYNIRKKANKHTQEDIIQELIRAYDNDLPLVEWINKLR
jgi:predicted nucleic acid-binding Zn ribbon protein